MADLGGGLNNLEGLSGYTIVSCSKDLPVMNPRGAEFLITPVDIPKIEIRSLYHPYAEDGISAVHYHVLHYWQKSGAQQIACTCV
jgi:hypothetical protein